MHLLWLRMQFVNPLLQIDHLLSLAAHRVPSKDLLPEICTQLNTHLATRTFFVGYSLTLADFALWSALHG